jgi:hypothetical protein
VGARVAFLSNRAYAELDVADAFVPIPDSLKRFPGEAFGCAVNIFARSDVRAGQTVAIIGAGFLGNALVQLCKAARGEEVLRHDRRLHRHRRGGSPGSSSIAPTMPSELFRRAEEELDALLAAARDGLARRGIGIADGSAREEELWSFRFSTEREIGLERQRISTTVTLRGDALITQSIATGSRVQHRASALVQWPELRSRGLAGIVEDALASAQYHLQVKTGADFAHEEFIRRCDAIVSLLGDDIPNAPALRERVSTWKALAEQRSLYSAVRRNLIEGLDFGHLQDDADVLQEYYETNIYGPLSSRAEARDLVGQVVQEPEQGTPRRIALIDQIPKAPAVEAPKSMLVLGLALAAVAAALIALGSVKHSWPLGIGGAILLILVARALWQWHAS